MAPRSDSRSAYPSMISAIHVCKYRPSSKVLPSNNVNPPNNGPGSYHGPGPNSRPPPLFSHFLYSTKEQGPEQWACSGGGVEVAVQVDGPVAHYLAEGSSFFPIDRPKTDGRVKGAQTCPRQSPFALSCGRHEIPVLPVSMFITKRGPQSVHFLPTMFPSVFFFSSIRFFLK